jgi:hypothetical protein
LIDLKSVITFGMTRRSIAPRCCEEGLDDRPTDLPPNQAKRLAELECPEFETRPWVTGRALSIPRAVALGVLVRRRAASDRVGAALAAGPSSAARGGLVFVFAWPWDDCLHISCSIVTTVGRAAVVRLSRW